ncbi:CUGBP Elav-like family member 3 isoform X4 [Strongylocentrotus purpuratus]|uniref:RRM domain-containing protein n=1 Tax=Strongylocentrotus purpuratus TaxID=7668 RepID=A0A7M7P0Y6_STRPU|nr:CUGBP Elav-like family member 3 isoform X4 [Strongylocentrotus purpuratus]
MNNRPLTGNPDSPMMMNTGEISGVPPPQTAQPDPDSLKMFVGQIPKAYEEDKLREMFSEFGPVYELNVLRDKKTGESKGCAFVTFYSGVVADKAQKELHNRKVLPGMRHPIQMKPADCEGRHDGNDKATGFSGMGLNSLAVEERKLFVGMLSKKCDESDVRIMFSAFGSIEECHILRDQMGGHKGCAFVTYATRQMALNCIRSMHQSRIMDGCTSKLVVKFADTQKEKEQKKLQQMAQQMCYNNLLQMACLGGGGGGGMNNQPPQQQSSGLNNPYLFPDVVNAQAMKEQTIAQNAFLQLAQQAAAAGGGGGTGGMGNVSNLANLQLPGHEYSSSPVGQTALTMPQLAALASAVNQQQNSTGGQGQNALAQSQALLAAAQGNSIMGVTPGSTGGTATTASTMTPAANTNSLVAGLTGLHSGLHQNLQSNTGHSGMGSNPSLGGYRGLPKAMPFFSSDKIGAGTNTTQSMTGLTAGLQGLAGTGLPSSIAGVGSLGTAAGLAGTGPTTAPTANIDLTALTQAYSGIQQYTAQFPNGFGPINAFQQQQQQQQAGIAGQKQKEGKGPEGANLFIYHLPQDYTDTDLISMFSPYGGILSAKVFIDKNTNLSKCFGFVSYDQPMSAQAAIQAMNGFSVGTKRLKVQLKRSKEANKPY